MTLIEAVRQAIAANLNQRSALTTEADGIVAGAEQRAADGEAPQLTDDERTRFDAIRSDIANLDAERRGDESDTADTGLEGRLAALEAQEAADAEARAAAAALPTASDTTSGANRRGAELNGVVRVGEEPRTYAQERDPEGRNFMRDVMRSHIMNDPGATQRLARHMDEERTERRDAVAGIEERATSTGEFTGLVVPQYLVELAAPVVRARRPFADVCRPHTLPGEGMTVNISRITTGADAGEQATENTAVTEQDMDDTLLTIPVRTIAGSQTVSRQAIERGSGIDSITIEDLIGAYHSRLDWNLINGNGAAGQHLGIANVAGNVAVTYTDATPTVDELFPKYGDLIQQISSATDFGLTHFLFHPRRWWWQATQLSPNHPLVNILSGNQMQVGNLGSNNVNDNSGRDILQGSVVLDKNIATDQGAGTEDAIYGVDSTECHLWEDPNAPMMIRAEQTNAKSLGVDFVIYGYSAFTAGRYPGASGDITGTGLIAPTF